MSCASRRARGSFDDGASVRSSPSPTTRWDLSLVAVWQYVTRLWEQHKQVSGGRLTLPLVIPVVVYHGERPWSAALGIDGLMPLSSDSREAAGELVPRFRYVLDDLTRLDAIALRARALPALATLALWALRSASDRSFVGVVTHLADLFDEVRAADDGAEALRTLFGYLSIISRAGEDLVRDVAAHLNEPVKEEIMEIEEMLARKKLEEGRVEGRAEGRTEGRAAMLLKQFQLKFGAVPADVDGRVRAATDEEVDRWAERVLTAASLEDVLR